jgi:hypothetical protein
MQTHRDFKHAGTGAWVLGSAVVLGILPACNREPPPTAVVVQPATAVQSAPVQAVQEPSDVAMPDDYVYYPQYEVYYSSRRHQYGYRNGNTWAWRPSPPRVGINVLLASPSVRMDFHDSPSLHHANTVRAYPHNWTPPADGRDDRK